MGITLVYYMTKALKMITFQKIPKNLAEFKRIIETQDRLNIVIFTSDWSGGGYLVATSLKMLGHQYRNKLNFFHLDAPDAGEIKTAYQLCQIPSLLFFYNGVLLRCLQGIYSRFQLEEIIDQMLNTIEEL